MSLINKHHFVGGQQCMRVLFPSGEFTFRWQAKKRKSEVCFLACRLAVVKQGISALDMS